VYRNFRVPFLVTIVTLLVGVAGAQHVLTTIPVGRGPAAILYDSADRKIFVANKGSGTVSVIDPVGNTVTATIRVDEGATALCRSGTSNKLFVACAPTNGNGSVFVINAATNEIIARAAVGPNPLGIVWSENQNRVYVMCMMPGGPIYVLGGADLDYTDVPVIPIPGQTPNAIIYNPTSGRVYVSSAVRGSPSKVWVINPQTDAVEATVTCGENAWELGVNPEANRVYCSNHGSASVTVIDGASNQKLADIEVQGEPHWPVWISTDKVFIGEYWDRTVAFMPGDSLRIAGRFPVPGNPGNMLYMPSSQKLFVADYLQNKVSACDARDGYEGVLVDLNVGGGPLGMVLYAPSNRVFVANSWDTTVTVISDATTVPIIAAPVNRVEEPLTRGRLLSPSAATAVPNPGSARRLVEFTLSGLEPERVAIRDAAGRLVHSAAGDGCGRWLPAARGIYFCTMERGLSGASCKLTVR
jgi:YVTN family beta-propeller protein